MSDSGRHDRTCSVEAAETVAARATKAQPLVFENSGHMTFVEENGRYISAIRDFLGRNAEHDGS